MGEFNSEMVVVAIKKKVVFSSHLSENHNMQYVCVSWSKDYMGYDHPSQNANPCNGYIEQFTEILTEFGANESRSTNAPSRLRGVRGVRNEKGEPEKTVQQRPRQAKQTVELTST